jgi:hypothetical protein
MNPQLRQNVNLNLTTQLTNIGKGLEIFNKQNEDKKKTTHDYEEHCQMSKRKTFTFGRKY